MITVTFKTTESYMEYLISIALHKHTEKNPCSKPFNQFYDPWLGQFILVNLRGKRR